MRHLPTYLMLVRVFEPVDYQHDTPTTGGLGRLRGEGWSAFAKVVQSMRHWARWPHLPDEARTAILQRAWWRQEVDLYESDLAAVLPSGLRLPAVRGVVDLGDDRLLLVLEDVDADASPWEVDRFARAARLLGRLHVRLTAADHLPWRSRQEPSELVRTMYQSRLLPVALPQLEDDTTWRHPLLAPERELRADLAELARRLPALVESVARLRQVRSHGDATPHNLLVPRDDRGTFVIIDWAMATLAAVGDDLGQLLVGQAHDGVLVAADLPPLREVLIDEYARGLADEGQPTEDEEIVRAGMDVGLAVRSAFTALPRERLAADLTDELAGHITQRIDLTRYLVELGLEASTHREALVS
jgi:hypothetical protein